MVPRKSISIEFVRSVLSYDAESGLFSWLVSPRRGMPAFSNAGSLSKRYGYVLISLKSSNYLAHRLAWVLHYGEWPTAGLDVDHIDGNRANNKISNLRLLTRQGNRQNMRSAASHSKSGLLGAYFHAKSQRWAATIKAPNAGSKHLGYFGSAEEAHAAYLSAKRQLHDACTI